jgi:hypothetical protein
MLTGTELCRFSEYFDAVDYAMRDRFNGCDPLQLSLSRYRLRNKPNSVHLSSVALCHVTSVMIELQNKNNDTHCACSYTQRHPLYEQR